VFTECSRTLSLMLVCLAPFTASAQQRGAAMADTVPLTAEMRIGEDSEDGTVGLGRIAALAVDSSGRLFVSDLHGPGGAVVWVFGTNGQLQGQVGRKGTGPGEYVEPDAGLRVLPDGRLVVRDPPTRRFLFYTPEGKIAGQQFFPPNRTSIPLFLEGGGHLLTSGFVRSTQRGRLGDFILLRMPIGSERIDTISVPEVPDRSIEVWGGSGSAYNRMRVPFSPRPLWTWSHRGHFVLASTEQYRLDLIAPTGQRRTISQAEPRARVTAPEREAARALITRQMRQGIPNWSWTGPDVPALKPYIRAIVVGDDGRIWVLKHTELTPDALRRAAQDPEALNERVVVDVFSPAGTKLWTAIGPPMSLQLWSTPVASGNRLWVVARDPEGAEFVVRFRAGAE
jgi:hypothetical protein